MSAPLARTPSTAETMLELQFAALATQDKERLTAFERFVEKGLPTRRDEAWHYTDLRARFAAAAPLAPRADEARLAAAKQRLDALPRLAPFRLTFVDGRFVASLSDDLPATVASSAPDFDIPLEVVPALNLAFADGPLSLALAAGELSFEIVRLDGPGAIYSRLALWLPERSQVKVFERFEGGGAGTQRNAVTLLNLGEGARLDWTTLVDDKADLHLQNTKAWLETNCVFNDFALVAGPGLARRQLDVRHDGQHAKIALSGLSLIDGQRHADTTLTVRHAAPHGQSREFFRHIVADEGQGVYQGKVIVDKHAQKTDGGMKSQALLLSPTAEMNNKPELEIFADDVVCGHGATVGALDPEQLFYLQARGVPKREAEAMLLEAFGAEAIERVADESIAAALVERLQAWLKGRATS